MLAGAGGLSVFLALEGRAKEPRNKGVGGPAGTNKLLVVVSQSPRDERVFRPSQDSAGGPLTYAVADWDGRRRLIDFFVGKGVKGRSTSMAATLLDIQEVQ